MSAPVIGVTGSMGSGKSTFARFLAADVGEHLDADEIANRMLEPGEPGYDPVVDAFGEAILDDDGRVDHTRLADHVFGDEEKLNTLESILHPLVGQRIAEAMSDCEAVFYVLDVPLLFESGTDELCDHVVVVTAPLETVQQRLAETGISPDEVKRRRSRQMSEERKIDRADEVVENTGRLDELKDRAASLRARILNGRIVSSTDG